MAIKYPRICMGITVTGTATIRTALATVGTNITIPEGTYWADPVYGANADYTSSTVHTISAIGILTAMITADGTDAGVYTAAMTSAAAEAEFIPRYSQIGRSASTVQILAANAANTTAGRRFLRFLGWDTLTDQAAAATILGQYVAASYDVQRGESGSPDEEADGFGATMRTGSGFSYAYDVGAPLLSRMVTFKGLRAESVKRRLGVPSITTGGLVTWDFETLMWPWLSRGSPCRYYANTSATATYLTAALTATAVTASVNSGTGIANNTALCIDGEWVYVTSGGTTTTLTIRRDNPIAHPIYAPCSTDFVGTYVLGQSGGNVNMRGFKPERRSEGDDRWDVTIALDRTNWT